MNFSARSFLALVFVVAAVAKLFDLKQFVQRVGDFGLIHDAAVMPAAWTIVLVELLAGIALVLHIRRGLICTVALLLLFISVLTYGMALGLDVECGCFGPAFHVSLGTQLLIDFGLILVCAIVYWSDDRRNCSHFAPRSQNPSTDIPI